VDFELPGDDDPRRLEVRAWLAEHPTPSGRELAEAGYVAPHWPRPWGLDADPIHQLIIDDELRRARVRRPQNQIGIGWAGPTILHAGSDAQKERYLFPLLAAEEIWCQLFSEPEAGSDLAALSTRAVPVDGGWRLEGQKVWTSYAQFARWGIALVRTDPDAPKHRGISYVVVDMEAEGIEIRPLVQITGEAEFNEVFFDGAFVPEDHLVGGLHQGWAVASTTLAHERGTAFPFKEQVVHEVFLDELYALAEERELLDDVEVSDALAQSFVDRRILRLHNWATLSRLGRGIEPGPESSVTKLAWTDMTQHLSDAALAVVGEGAPLAGPWSRQWLWSKAASIAGGTSEVQRTIIGDRILGLPR
jgi:alkylation response protein AidB-like acyl-CoA dehydrogenase